MFGEYIRKKRLEMKMGLRTFAEQIGEDAGNWSRIETGRFPAPNGLRTLNLICRILKITDKEMVYDLAAKSSKEKIPVDIKNQIKENEIVPILFRTIEKKHLSKNDIKNLIKRIKDEY